jgi:hypothetical protein
MNKSICDLPDQFRSFTKIDETTLLDVNMKRQWTLLDSPIINMFVISITLALDDARVIQILEDCMFPS